ncbi:MAG: hypothetical protein JNK50_01130 [Bacteroidia bacterium]|nr:hypothetical protein [Bacteroidia bacterium]
MHKIELSEDEIERISSGLADLGQTFMDSIKSWEKVCKSNEQLLSTSGYAGKIIHCHLVIENLLKNSLISLGSKKEVVEKLKFSEKLKKLPTEGKLFCCLLPGVDRLNYIRNQITHNINYEVTTEDMSEIDIYLTFFKLADPAKLSIEERVSEFTYMCIKLFSVSSIEVKGHWDNFSKQYPTFFKEMGEIGKKVKLGPHK